MKAAILLTGFLYLQVLSFSQTFDAQVASAATSLRQLRNIRSTFKTKPISRDDFLSLRVNLRGEARALDPFINSGENVQIRLAYYYKTLISYELAAIEILSEMHDIASVSLHELLENFKYLANKKVYPIEYYTKEHKYYIDYSTVLPILRDYHKKRAIVALQLKDWEEAKKALINLYDISEDDHQDRYFATDELMRLKVKKNEFDTEMVGYIIDNIETLLSMTESEVQAIRDKGFYDVNGRLAQLELIFTDNAETVDRKSYARLGFIFSNKEYNKRKEASEFYALAVEAGYNDHEMMPTILSLAAEVNDTAGMNIILPVLDSLIAAGKPADKASSYEHAGNSLSEFKHYSKAFFFYKKALQAGYSGPAGFLAILETARYLKNDELNEMMKETAEQELGNNSMKIEVMAVWTEVAIKLQDHKLADAFADKMGKAMDKMKLEDLCPQVALMQLSFMHWGYLDMAGRWAAIGKKCTKQKL